MKAAQAGGLLGTVALAWTAAVAARLVQPSMWAAAADVAVMVAGALALGLGWWLHRRCHAPVMALVCLVGAMALLAWGSTGWRTRERLVDRLAGELEGVNLVVVGRVSSLPQRDADGVRFAFDIERACREACDDPVRGSVAVPHSVWLSWSRSDQAAEPLSSPVAVRGGERWQLPVRLRRPHGVLNPAGFDAELWFFEQQLGAQGTVRDAASAAGAWRLGPPRWWVPGDALPAARDKLRDAVLLAVGDARLGGVLAALTVGDQAAIGSEDWVLFQRTGVAHLMSISGLHITLFAWLAAQLVSGLWRRLPGACLRWPAQSAARWGGLALAVAYCALAGWGVPAQRTVGMLALTVALRQAGLHWPAGLVMVWAAMLVSLWDPWALLQPGFWLSFMAVALLMMSEPVRSAPGAPPAGWRERGAALLREGVRAQTVATLGLAPLAMVCFQQFSVVGWLANLLAVPVVTFIVTPLALAGLLFTPALTLAAGALQPVMAWLQLCMTLGGPAGASWSVPVSGPGVAVLALLGSAGLMAPLPWRLRAPWALLILPLAWPAVPRPLPGHMSVVAADVGQGSAVLVRTARHLLMFDAGPQGVGDADAGRRVLVPLLQALGEPRIDRLVLSHPDLDHVGGAASVLRAVDVGDVLEGHLGGRPTRGQPCHAGQAWQWDGVRFDVLHPAADAPDPAGAGASNAVSCVLRVQDAAGHRLLLTGDIGQAQELALVHRYGDTLRADLLVLAHHGSRGSSAAEFLAAVRPRVAIIQAGYRNRFGHPHAEVLARLHDQGITVVRTDQCGAWWWDDAGAWCTRDVRRRVWHAMPAQSDP